MQTTPSQYMTGTLQNTPMGAWKISRKHTQAEKLTL